MCFQIFKVFHFINNTKKLGENEIAMEYNSLREFCFIQGKSSIKRMSAVPAV